MDDNDKQRIGRANTNAIKPSFCSYSDGICLTHRDSSSSIHNTAQQPMPME
jgi:hypothetical protein